MSIGLYTFSVVSKYDDKLYPNMYINDYNISNISKDEVESKVTDIASKIENSKIIFVANNDKYEYQLKDLGFTINKESLSNKILTYDNNFNTFEKMKKIANKQKTIFNYEISYSHDKIVSFVKTLKSKVDKKVIQGKLVMSSDRVLSYKKGTSSFVLDVNKTVNNIENKIKNILTDNTVKLAGSSENPKYDNLSNINTKVASYSTTFDHKVSRAKNIKNAAQSFDGVILKPGEIFSFYKYAGPYNKKGYVYYDGVMGNGVCQVASTLYNVELLAGLKTIERYAHAYKMTYVKGGLDATVSANKNGNRLNFRFKNTYDYPIYISAFVSGGTLTIEFWSNDKAKEGKEFKTESVQVGPKGYKTYLLTYKNGKQISRDYLATTWYPK